MSAFNDNGAGDEIKQGKYANAFLLFLMAALVAVASYFAYQSTKDKSEYQDYKKDIKLEEEDRRNREDKIRQEYQAKLDNREKYHEERYNLLQYKIDSLRDNIIADSKMNTVRSEVLATKSKKTAQSFQAEVRKTTNAAKELDSISKSVTESLSQ